MHHRDKDAARDGFTCGCSSKPWARRKSVLPSWLRPVVVFLLTEWPTLLVIGAAAALLAPLVKLLLWSPAG